MEIDQTQLQERVINLYLQQLAQANHANILLQAQNDLKDEQIAGRLEQEKKSRQAIYDEISAVERADIQTIAIDPDTGEERVIDPE